MVLFYWVTFVVAVLGLLMIVGRGKLQNIFHPLLGLSIVICNGGYLALAYAKDLPTALLANSLTYLGSFLPFFLFMIVTDTCGVKIKQGIEWLLSVASFAVSGLAFTAGYNSLYYEEVSLKVENGMSYLVKTPGPFHLMYDVLLLGYALATIGFLIYSYRRRTKISYKTIIMLGICLLSGILIYEVRRFSFFPLDLMPLSYDLMVIGLVVACSHIDMYDMSQNVINAWEHMEEYGYITFDQKANYMGCNDFALKHFASLADCRIDSPIKVVDDDNLAELLKWLDAYKRGEDIVTQIKEIDNRSLKITLKTLRHQRTSRITGYLVEFFDVTREQKYINMIENYNNNLEREVANKVSHISYIKDMMVLGMASLVENRDTSTGGHVRRTTEVVAIFAQKLMEYTEEFDVSREFLNRVIKAAPMHDLGKIAVNDNILRKQGDYIEKEYEEMKLHAAEGARIVDLILQGVEDDEFVVIARNMAHYHHERWNGMGYPEGLKGAEIPLEARIMALADVFDALVSKRCYKEAYSYNRTFEMIKQGLGGQFDPRLGEIFISCRPKLEQLYSHWEEFANNATEQDNE